MSENKSKRDELAKQFQADDDNFPKSGPANSFKAGYDSALEHATAQELKTNPLVNRMLECLGYALASEYLEGKGVAHEWMSKALEPFMQAKDEV